MERHLEPRRLANPYAFARRSKERGARVMLAPLVREFPADDDAPLADRDLASQLYRELAEEHAGCRRQLEGRSSRGIGRGPPESGMHLAGCIAEGGIGHPG